MCGLSRSTASLLPVLPLTLMRACLRCLMTLSPCSTEKQRLLHLHVLSVLTIAMLIGKWVRCSKMKSDTFSDLFFCFLVHGYCD